jgi:hypothetical protein
MILPVKRISGLVLPQIIGNGAVRGGLRRESLRRSNSNPKRKHFVLGSTQRVKRSE